MGFTKNKGLSIVIGIIVLILFNIISFALPFGHTINFWTGYSFGIFSILFLLSSILIILDKPDINDKFHGLPIVTLTWIYFVLQMVLSFWQMISFDFPYSFGIIADSVIAGIFTILIILTYSSTNEIKKIEENVQAKVFYIRNLRTETDLLQTTDKEIAVQIESLKETIRFSDPMSHSLLSDIENKITDKFDLLKNSLGEKELALSLLEEIQQLFSERNKKCKVLKNVPEPKPEKDNSGIRIVAVAFGVISILALIILIGCFIIIPHNQYKTALELYDNQNYQEALSTFEKLGNYRDSESKVEQIYNMFATGDEEVYFGTYNGSPISWKALKTEKDRMFLIAQDPIVELPFNNELKNITWSDSSIKDWLNNDFLKEFSKEQKNRIIKKLYYI